MQHPLQDPLLFRPGLESHYRTRSDSPSRVLPAGDAMLGPAAPVLSTRLWGRGHRVSLRGHTREGLTVPVLGGPSALWVEGTAWNKHAHPKSKKLTFGETVARGQPSPEPSFVLCINTVSPYFPHTPLPRLQLRCVPRFSQNESMSRRAFRNKATQLRLHAQSTP